MLRRSRFYCAYVVRALRNQYDGRHMETVNLSFRYAERDYVRALRAHYASRLRLPLDVAVTVGLVVIGLYEWRSGREWFGITALCVSGAFALLLIAVFTVLPQAVFRRQPRLRDEYSLTFSPQGIHFKTARIDSEIQWSLYCHALVDAHSFVLYSGSHQFSVIPKRVFHNAAQREAFERLLAANVPKVVDKTK